MQSVLRGKRKRQMLFNADVYIVNSLKLKELVDSLRFDNASFVIDQIRLHCEDSIVRLRKIIENLEIYGSLLDE